MSKKNEIMCGECFALIEECDCNIEMPYYPNPPVNHHNVRCVATPKKEIKTRGGWEPNIKKNEKWFSVASPYKAYKDGV